MPCILKSSTSEMSPTSRGGCASIAIPPALCTIFYCITCFYTAPVFQASCYTSFSEIKTHELLGRGIVVPLVYPLPALHVKQHSHQDIVFSKPRLWKVLFYFFYANRHKKSKARSSVL